MITEAINEGYRLFEQARQAVTNDPKAREHVESARMELQYVMLDELPGDDPRLKEEIFSLLRLAKKLEINTIDHTPRSDYRARIGEKLGIEIPD